MEKAITASLTVREMEPRDIPLVAEYWLNADVAYLRGMGADPDKLPAKEQFEQMLGLQLQLSYAEKQSYGLVWEVEGEPMGHSNVNKIIFGQEAYMHLHIWKPEFRKSGYGLELVKMGVPLFFRNLQLQKLYCEPYALNPAPNRLLEKAGFQLLKEYVTIPGTINFEQPVKLWGMNKAQMP